MNQMKAIVANGTREAPPAQNPGRFVRQPRSRLAGSGRELSANDHDRNREHQLESDPAMAPDRGVRSALRDHRHRHLGAALTKSSDPDSMQRRSPHASGVLVRVGSQAPQVPRPRAVDPHLQREAEDDPNGDDHPEHPNAHQRRVDDDRANNVPDDEHFQAEQDGLAELSTQPPVTLPRVTQLSSDHACPPRARRSPKLAKSTATTLGRWFRVAWHRDAP